MYEYHDVPTAGHPGRDKMYSLLARDFYWNHQYKWVRKYSVSMDFVFGLSRDSRRKIGIVTVVNRFSKMTEKQTERVNRVLVDLLKSYAQSFHNWDDYLRMAEFAINNAVHA
ncbi:reverse transcriptase, partial [Phytophthora megakarya]